MSINEAQDLMEHLGRATNIQELKACLGEATGREDLLEVLGRVADDLERIGANRSRALLLDLMAMLARSLDFVSQAEQAEAQRDVLSATVLPLYGRVDEATPLLDQAAETFAGLGEYLRSFHARVVSAQYLLQSGRLDEGILQASSALDALEEFDLDDDAAATLVHRLGRELYKSPTRDETAVVLARASRILRRMGYNELSHCVASHLGCILVRIGQIEYGLEILFDASNTLRRYGTAGPDGTPRPFQEALEGAYWTARAFHLMGRELNAEKAYRSHLWWRDEYGLDEDRAELRTRLAELLIECDRYQECLDLLRSFGSVWPNELASYAALTQALASKVYTLLNRSREGAAMADEARTLLDNLSPDEAALRARLCLVDQAVLSGSRNLAHAEADFAQVKREADAIGLSSRDLPLEQIEGDLFLAQGNADKALRCYREALDAKLTVPIATSWRKHWTEEDKVPEALEVAKARDFEAVRKARGIAIDLYLRIAHAQVAAGEDAEEALDSAIAAARHRNRHSTLFYSLVDKATMLRRQGKNQESMHCLEGAADVLEGLRSNFRDVELQVGTLTDKESVYAQILNHAIEEPPDPVLAQRTMERAKARALLDSIAGALSASKQSGDPMALARARSLREGIVREMRRRFTEGESSESRKRLQEMKDQLSYIYQMQYRADVLQPHGGATPNEICQLASLNTAVLHFFCDATQIFVSPVVSGRLEEISILPGISPEEVRDLLDVFHLELRSRNACRSLEELYQRLFAPLERFLEGVTRLLIIPHSILHAVPFHALRRPDGRYVVERVSVAYAPNAAVARLAARRLVEPLPDLALSAGFAVGTTAYLPLGRLTTAISELQSVAENVGNLVLYKNEQAIRRHLFELEEVEVMHFGCHGEFDDVDPLMSRLYLADGPVYAYELLGMAARPRLVVLSACETAVHERRPGDEVFGLARPFLSRVAGGVVATLWKVADASTCELMKAFYAKRKSAGNDLPSCLQSAQLSLLSIERYKHPYYWAPYILIGSHPIPTHEELGDDQAGL